jgi:hypothetical protein
LQEAGVQQAVTTFVNSAAEKTVEVTNKTFELGKEVTNMTVEMGGHLYNQGAEKLHTIS